MKRVILLLAIVLSNSLFLSCSGSTTASDDNLYEQADGGDNGEVNDDPDGGNN